MNDWRGFGLAVAVGMALSALALWRWQETHKQVLTADPLQGVPLTFSTWEVWDWQWSPPELGCADFPELAAFPLDCGLAPAGQIHRFSTPTHAVWRVMGMDASELVLDSTWSTRAYPGGVLIARPEALAAWDAGVVPEQAGEVHPNRAHWHPRGMGKTKLESGPTGLQSAWQPLAASAENFTTTWSTEGDSTSVDSLPGLALLVDGRQIAIGSTGRPLARSAERGNLASEGEGAPSVRPVAQLAASLGTVRNHRLGKRMDVRWDREGRRVEAWVGEERVWSIGLQTEEIPLGEAFEVDLYKNRKFQCAFATSQAVHLIDVLGREVQGFPIRPSKSDITAFLVADYDGKRDYRFLVGLSDGRLLNYREEAEKTPGWKHASQGSALRHIAHIRVGVKDYLYAGSANGEVRLLQRGGSDRTTTPVIVPPLAPPAFRIGSSIANTTVLFADKSGWIREQRLGNAEDVGMSRMTKGVSVEVRDETNDGIPEVVVTAEDGSITTWDARNQRMSP